MQTLQDVVKIQEKENALLTEQVKQRQRVASEADKLLKATLAAQQKEVGKSSKEAQKKSEADIAQLLTQQVRLTKEKAAAEAKVLLTNGEQKNVYEQIAGRKETELEAVKKDIDARIKANNELSKSKAYIEGNEKVKRAEAEATDTVAKAEAKAADNAEKQNKA